MTKNLKRYLPAAAATAILLFQAGCRTAPVAPPPPVPPTVNRPAFEKTAGEALVDGGALSLKYKDMSLLIDPTPAMLTALGPTADFILYTRAGALAGPFRSGQKAIGPDDAAGAARAAGLSFKALSNGQRLMVRKDAAFAFVSAVRSRAGTGVAQNGYLLEFDNGRNLVILPPVADLAPVREFVYGLRDDGKSVYEGFFPQYGDPGAAAETAALLQPQFAVFTGAPKTDRAALTQALGNQMFAGESWVTSEHETVPF